jgi:hypothetical protein
MRFGTVQERMMGEDQMPLALSTEVRQNLAVFRQHTTDAARRFSKSKDKLTINDD